MGLLSKRKGRLAEQQVVQLARVAGLDAERTWHTAQSPDATERACDVRIAGRAAQVKVAADGFGSLYGALEGVELAFVRADRRPWLAVLPAERLLDLVRRAR